MNSRCSVLWAKGGGVFVGWRVHVVTVLNLISQIFVDGAGLVADFELSKSRHPKEKVFVVNETLILWQALVVVPHLPVHAIKERALCELQV